MINKVRGVILAATIIIVSVGLIVLSYVARGYRFDMETFKFIPSGLFVVKSDPDGAQLFVNGELKTATNASISLSPGIYNIVLRKEGYISWEKRIEIQKEVVTQIDAMLFRSAPSLSALTFSSLENPHSTKDQTKIGFIIPPQTESNGNKAGLWVIETSNLPIGFSKDPRLITDGDLANATWLWSPDGSEILLTIDKGVFLLDTGKYTPQNERINISSKLDSILADWQKEETKKLNAKIKRLPDELVSILERKVDSLLFSPNENKILYTASGSASIPIDLIKPVPGASTQKQERNIKENLTYVYDIKEDRNFEIGEIDPSQKVTWFPTSDHLMFAENEKVTIMDYDGTNRQSVYTGAYEVPHAFSTPSKDRLLILTSLGAISSPPNLYSLNLK